MQTRGWGKQICQKPMGTLYECGEATLHQHPVWQPASDNVQLHSCRSESEIPPGPGRPGAEPGARDGRPRERRNLPRASHPAQLPALLSVLQTSLMILVLLQGLGTYPSLCLNPLCNPAFTWRVCSLTQASVQMPPLTSHPLPLPLSPSQAFHCWML